MILRLKTALRLIVKNPKFFWRKFYYSFFDRSQKQKTSHQIGFKDVSFNLPDIHSKQIKAMSQKMYEPETILLLEKILKKGDVFFDVGANIGYISAYALSLVGKPGVVYSFEPVSYYYENLQNLVEKNPNYSIKINRVALGDKVGEVEIYINDLKFRQNIGLNSLLPSHMDERMNLKKEKVHLTTLSKFISENSIDGIKLIKIDTEGFEFPVLKGLEAYIHTSKNKPFIICEIDPNSFKYFSISISEFAEFIQNLGYCCHTYNVFGTKEKFNIRNITTTIDILLIPKEKRE